MTPDLKKEIKDLRRRLAEAESTIEAIRCGAVDAFVVLENGHQKIYTLEGADLPYRLLVQRMHQGAVTLTAAGDIAFYNQRFADLVNVPYHQLTGKSFSEFVDFDDPNLYSECLRKGLTSDVDAEGRLIVDGSNPIPVDFTFSALDPESGVAVGVLVSDLSSQRSFERLQETTQQLEINELRYRTLFHSIDEGFCILELLYDESKRCNDFRMIEVNPAFEKHTGLANAAGRRILEMVPGLESHWFAYYGEVAATGESKRIIEESKEMGRWFSIYAFRLEGIQEGDIAVLFADITEQRKIEMELKHARSRLESTLSTAEIGTWEFDIREQKVYADVNLARMFGVRAEDANGGPLDSYLLAIHCDDRDRVSHEITAVLEAGEYLEIGYRIAVHDQPERHVIARGRVERGVEGRALRMPGVVMDVTAQRLAEESLRKSEIELREFAISLKEADQRKNEFLATLAHELRNPLAPIKSAAQLMQMVDDPAELQKLSALIDRQANQMVRLIDDLLDVSRISRGKIKLHKKTVNLRDIVSVALESAAPFMEASRQTLHVDLCEEPLFVSGDAARLTQILVNLLNNAAKYTPASGEIWLSLQRRSEEACLIVRDNGIGLAPDSVNKVFDMFEQVDVSKERGQSGLGIGLSLAKTLVDMHDGRIGVESHGLGQGCSFEISLPLLVESIEENPEPADESPPAVFHSPLRILVVDDTRPIRYVLSQMLRSMGHEVIEAEDGRDGLSKATHMIPDMIFSDISMPNMNGHELAREIRRHPLLKSVRMIALTGFGQNADKQNAIDSGFDDHVVKPVDVNVIRNKLTAFCLGR